MHFQMIAEGALGIGTYVGSTLLRKKRKKEPIRILLLPQMYKDRYSPSAPAEKYEMPSLDEFLSGNLFHPPSGTGPGTRARNSCQICAKTKQEDKKHWSKKSYCKFTQKKNSQKLIFHTRRRKIMIDYKGVPKYRWPSTTSTKVIFRHASVSSTYPGTSVSP